MADAHARRGRADALAVTGIRFSVPLEAQEASYFAASARISSLRCISILESL